MKESSSRRRGQEARLSAPDVLTLLGSLVALMLVAAACTTAGTSPTTQAQESTAAPSTVVAAPSTTVAVSSTTTTQVPSTVTTQPSVPATPPTFAPFQVALLDVLRSMGLEAKVPEHSGPNSAQAMVKSGDEELFLVWAYKGTVQPLGDFTMIGSETVDGIEFLALDRRFVALNYAFACGGDTLYEVASINERNGDEDVLELAVQLAATLDC